MISHIDKIFIYTLVISFVINISCKKTESKDIHAIARVGENYLYESDIVGLLPLGTNPKDSINIVKNYVDSWIRKMVMLEKAKAYLPIIETKIQKRVEDYRNSLIVYEYQKEIIKQKLDTNVTDNEIVQYYNQNKENFVLKDNIIKVIFVKLPKNAPNLNKAKNLCFSNKPEDKKLLLDYCRQFADNYYLEDDTWLLFNDLLKEVPIKTYDQEAFLQNNRNIEIADSLYVYYVNIKDFKIKETSSPLSFEYNNIKTLIINKRKLDLIKKIEKSSYDEALDKNLIEIYK